MFIMTSYTRYNKFPWHLRLQLLLQYLCTSKSYELEYSISRSPRHQRQSLTSPSKVGRFPTSASSQYHHFGACICSQSAEAITYDQLDQAVISCSARLLYTAGAEIACVPLLTTCYRVCCHQLDPSHTTKDLQICVKELRLCC